MEVKAKKSLGQHFLTDQSIAKRIVDSLQGSPVLEVGPGMGILTRYLLERNHIEAEGTNDATKGTVGCSEASLLSAPPPSPKSSSELVRFPSSPSAVPPLNMPRVAVSSLSEVPSVKVSSGVILSKLSDPGSLRGTPLSPPPGVQGGKGEGHEALSCLRGTPLSPPPGVQGGKGEGHEALSCLRGTPLSPPPGVQGGESSRRLKAVEIDRESVAYLRKHFPGLGDGLLEGDFLKMDLGTVYPEPYSIIGNFPYNISSQIFFKIIESRDLIPEVVCMIQKEVAERIAEKPGTKTYGILSVFLQAWYDIEYLFTVGPGAFNPPPKVHSAVVRLTRNGRVSLGCDEKLFRTIVKTAFGQRRKTLRNSLRGLCSSASFAGAPDLTDPVFDLRPERLSVEDFIALTLKLSGSGRE